jgi:hypothetical protein
MHFLFKTKSHMYLTQLSVTSKYLYLFGLKLKKIKTSFHFKWSILIGNCTVLCTIWDELVRVYIALKTYAGRDTTIFTTIQTSKTSSHIIQSTIELPIYYTTEMQRYLSNLLNFNNKKITIKQNIVYQQKEQITNYLSNKWYLCLKKLLISSSFKIANIVLICLHFTLVDEKWKHELCPL